MGAGLPGVPEVAPGTDGMAAALLAPLKEIVEVREGLRGDPRSRFVTVGELIDWGLVDAGAALRAPGRKG